MIIGQCGKGTLQPTISKLETIAPYPNITWDHYLYNFWLTLPSSTLTSPTVTPTATCNPPFYTWGWKTFLAGEPASHLCSNIVHGKSDPTKLLPILSTSKENVQLSFANPYPIVIELLARFQ